MKSFTVALVAFMAGICPTIMADDQRYLMVREPAEFENCSSNIIQEFFDYVPDLSVYSVDNDVLFVNVTGFWILYSDTNYQGRYNGYGMGGVDSCHSVPPILGLEASSLRYSGSPNGLNDDYYNLYEDIGFVGDEFRGDTNAQTVVQLDQDVSSLVITGQSPWTFYTGLNYTGTAVCVQPNNYFENDGVELNYHDIFSLDLIGLPDNSIRSVAKGCLSKKIVGTPPSKASPHPEGDHEVVNNAH